MSALLTIMAQAGSDSARGLVGGNSGRDLVIGLLTGVAFGAILQRAGASSYSMITNMLRLKDLTIMKFLLLAIATGSVGIYVIDAVGTAHIGIAPLYIPGIVAGGLVFGVGWAMAGYCPGTALVAMSQGKADAAITVAGGLAGAATLAFTWDWLRPLLVDPLNYGGESLASVLNARPLLVALFLAALIVAFVLFLDHVEAERTLFPRRSRPAGK